ncbi:MAG: ABC-F family ATP-binding cassette domain-containing protein [Victivallales bacterium]|nr:ABC-F family ATP-binding cassette domain-containing protein [Victivallales bacterium]
MIDFQNVSKSYPGQDILTDVSFRINPGERVGVVGPNGAGKSTLFGIITGELEPDQGKVMVPGDMRVALLHQQLEAVDATVGLLDFAANAVPEIAKIHARMQEIEHLFHDNRVDAATKDRLLQEQGVLQSRFEQIGGYRLRHTAEAALSGLGFRENQFSRPLKSFSGGWQMRAALARVLISEPDILLLDEPSNYLDIPAVEWLYRFLRSFKGTLLLISHDRFLLKSLTTITLEINSSRVNRYPGDYDYYVRERDNRLHQLQAAKENQARERERLERSIARFRSKATKAVQVQNWLRKLDRMTDIALPDQLHYAGAIRIPPPPHCGVEIARLEQVDFSYDGKNMILQNVELQINHGDKIAIVGYNGMGKTTLLRLLAGRLEPTAGQRVLGHNVVVGYQAQEFSELLPPEQSVYDVVRAALPAGGDTRILMNLLGSFGFCGDDTAKLCRVLSGGEKIRLLFARIFVNPPNFLLLDEPTTHLDIAAREALQQALAQYEGTVCLVSHDIEFISNVAENIIAMTPQGIHRYYGNYHYYREKSEQLSGNADEATPGTRLRQEETGLADSPRENARNAPECAGKCRPKNGVWNWS